MSRLRVLRRKPNGQGRLTFRLDIVIFLRSTHIYPLCIRSLHSRLNCPLLTWGDGEGRNLLFEGISLFSSEVFPWKPLGLGHFSVFQIRLLEQISLLENKYFETLKHELSFLKPIFYQRDTLLNVGWFGAIYHSNVIKISMSFRSQYIAILF